MDSAEYYVAFLIVAPFRRMTTGQSAGEHSTSPCNPFHGLQSLARRQGLFLWSLPWPMTGQGLTGQWSRHQCLAGLPENFFVADSRLLTEPERNWKLLY